MQCGADGCKLAHGTVTKIFAVESYRGKKKRDCGGREKVRDPDRRRDADTALPFPWRDIVHPLIERNRLPGGVAPGGNAKGMQSACLDTSLDAMKRQTIFQ